MAIGDEKVTIRIDVKADTAAIDRVRQKLRQLCREADDCADTFERYSKSVDDSSESHKDLDRNSTNTSKKLRQMGKEANKLANILKTSYKFAFIGAGIETAALALALSSVNGLLATGRFLVRTYHYAMSGMAKAAAAAGVALATVASAQRQFVAAQATGRYGGSFKASSQGLRTLQGDARLASLGLSTLSGAFAAASKNAKVTGGTASAIAGLMDFAVASGDIEKGASAVATLVSLVQKGGAGGKGVLEAAKQLGPEFEKAFTTATKGGKATSEELMKLFSSGELAKQAGLAGGFAATQGTLLGQLKAFMTNMQVMFADLGMRFIEPMQRAFEEVRRIMTRTVTQLMPVLDEFAREKFIDKLVNGVDVIAKFLVKLMQDYVPTTQNFFSKMSSAWDKLTNGFERFGRYLRQFSAASKIINKFLGQLLGAIGRGFKTNFENFAELLVENQDEFDKFGNKLGDLITSIFNLFKAIRTAFMDALPYITTVVTAIESLVNAFSRLFGLFGSSMGGFGSFLMLLAPFFLPGGGKFRGGVKKKMGGMGAAGKAGAIATAMALIGLGSAGGEGFTQGMMDIAGPAFLAKAVLPKRYGTAGAVAAGGTALAGKATDFAYQKGGRGASTATGALTYGATAAGTAAILAAPLNSVPIVGQGLYVGAIVIAGIAGAIYGGIKGWMKDGEYKKKARDAARLFVDEYSDLVESAFASNDYRNVERAMSGFSANAKAMSETQIKSGTALNEATELWAKESVKYEQVLKLMSSRTNDLVQITGTSTDEVIALANSMEVDLSNSLLSLQDVLAATGVAVERFGRDFNNEFTNTFGTAVAGIRTGADILNAPIVINEAAEALREAALSDTLTTEGLAGGLETLFQQQLLLSGGDPLEAYRQLIADIGAVPGTGGQFSIAGNVFNDPDGKIRKAMLDAGLGTMAGGAFEVLQTDLASMAAQNLISGAAGVGRTLGVDVNQLTTMLSRMRPDDLINLMDTLRQGPAFREQAIQPKTGLPYGQTFEQQLANLLNEDILAKLEPDYSEEQKTRDSIAKFEGAVGGFRNSTDTIFAEAVNKFDLAVDKIGGTNDTASPRSNIVNTLGAHSRFDMAIAGSRRITSGYRTWGLGSMSSDHASGRAYDLVGQNLGLYQMAVRANGGFAEFHGGTAGRHLHVVPNTSSPIGDATSPYMGQPMMMSSAGGSTVVNMTVNASPGMDVNALASEVMYRLEKETKSRQERY